MEKLKDQMGNALSIFEIMFPGAVGIWTFDNSSSHGAFSKDALRVNNMRLAPGGKVDPMHATTIPSDDPLIPHHLRGKTQTMVFEDGPHIGKPKGIAQVLKERGLWDYHLRLAASEKRSMTLKCKGCKERSRRQTAQVRADALARENSAQGFNVQANVDLNLASSAVEGSEEEIMFSETSKSCCWSKILGDQSDFANERNQLQQIIEGRGHVCVFLPKYHCECNPIEYYWAWVKSSQSPSHRLDWC